MHGLKKLEKRLKNKVTIAYDQISDASKRALGNRIELAYTTGNIPILAYKGRI